jgi:hypothetical protein
MFCGGEIVVNRVLASPAATNIENLLKLADTAAEAGNYKEAYDYYTKVLEKQSDHITAWCGKGEAAGWMSTLVDSRLTELTTAFGKAMEIARDTQKDEVRSRAVTSINAIISAYHTLAWNHVTAYVALGGAWPEYVAQSGSMITALEFAHGLSPSNKETIQSIINLLTLQITGIKYNDPYDNNLSKAVFLSDAYESAARQQLTHYATKMRAIEPGYVAPNPQRQSPGCFIATAALGDHDHPTVVLLRQFRDQWLLNRPSGKRFVEQYYRHSPGLAHVIARHVLLRRGAYYTIVLPAALCARLVLRSGKD